MPGPAALRLVRSLATRATTTFICTDADAGGVRIAGASARFPPQWSSIPARYPTPPRPRWQPDGSATAELQRALHGRARDLATACLERGYPVEQEATIIDIVTRALPNSLSPPKRGVSTCRLRPWVARRNSARHPGWKSSRVIFTAAMGST
ncbi:MAG: hypothetical protein M5T61_19950 [Acidimicrobiia bacterium]|nr:hypothetical protein [Acidimicrobiia bacterium]